MVTRLVGVTANRQLDVKAWTPFCISRDSHEASPISAGACLNMGYTEYRGFMFGISEFNSCQASDVGSIDVRFSLMSYVEIRIGPPWRELCNAGSGNFNVHNLCRSLGYDRKRRKSIASFIGSGVSMSCARDVKSIDECTFTEFQDKTCHRLLLVCENHDGKVRLLDGLRESEGRVEIYFSGSWSVVCGDEWYLDDANVVCRQLGYENAVSVTARRRGLLSPIDEAMYYGRCKGNETWFKDCEKERSRSCSKEAQMTCKENECKGNDIAIND